MIGNPLRAFLLTISWALGGPFLPAQVAPLAVPLRAFSEGPGAPARIATDSGGRIYVTHPAAGQVVVRDESGGILPGKLGLDRPLAIGVDASRRIYVGEEGSGSVSIFLPDWSFVGKLGQGHGEFLLPNHIALDAAGQIYVGDSRANLVKVYSPAGNKVRQFGGSGLLEGQFDFLAGVFVSPGGEVFVADQHNDRVQVFSTEGVFLRSFGKTSGMLGTTLTFGRMQGLTGDSAGRLFVADTLQGTVSIVDFSGRLLSLIGGPEEGPGQLNTPTSLVLDRNNRLFIVSTGNSRVVTFGLDAYSDPNVPQVAPRELTYATNPAIYLRGAAISPNTPSHAGGSVTAYTASPSLPAGLSLNPQTGVITGSPVGTAPTGNYTVLASNSQGSTTVELSITVKDLAPSALTYSAHPAVYALGSAITPNTPSHGGGGVSAYSISPGLPTGLSLNPGTGVISGIPSVLAPAATYTVTATNSEGSTTFELSITVQDQAPSGLTYPQNPVIYTRGVGIAPNTPTHGGGQNVSYTVAPALPAGLVLASATGIISGVPTALAPAATYRITASNSGGSTTADLVITVQEPGPGPLTYATNPAVYIRGARISPNAPTLGAGVASSYSVAPALPAGLYLDSRTGTLTGTPSALKPTTLYTVTATWAGGSATVALSITVQDLIPSALRYPTNPAVYIRGFNIPPNVPTQSGGVVSAYTVAPALPQGLYLDSRTGAIGGNPGALKAATVYTVTATNAAGSATALLSITVKDLIPSALVYPTNPAIYVLNVRIPANTPTHGGGLVTAYTVSPALPQGLYLDSRTGAIKGMPAAVKPAAIYTVTATNSEGSTTVLLSITVNGSAQ